MKNVIIYSRVSTKRQDTSSSTLMLEQHYKDKNKYNIVKVYEEKKSGKLPIFDRPVYKEMMEYIRANKDEVDEVGIHEISRFGRKNSDVMTVTDELIDLEVNIFSLKEQISLFHTDRNGNYTVDPSTKMVFSIISSIAENELSTIEARKEKGVLKRKNDGLSPGLSYAAYGYNVDIESGQITINDDEKKIVKKIFKLYVDSKYGSKKIMQYLNNHGIPTKHQNLHEEGKLLNRKKMIKRDKWCDTTINKILANKQYIKQGNYPTPRIISDKLFEAAAEIRNSRSNVGHTNRYNYLLPSKIVRCGECGCAMTITRNTTKYKGNPRTYTRYKCHGRKYNERCVDTHSIRVDKLNSAVWKFLIEQENELYHAFTDDVSLNNIDEKISDIKVFIKESKKELEEAIKEEERFVSNVSSLTFIDAELLKKQHTTIKKKQEKLSNDIDSYKTEISELKEYKEKFNDYKSFLRNVKGDAAKLRRLIDNVVSKIHLYTIYEDKLHSTNMIVCVEFVGGLKRYFLTGSKLDFLIKIPNLTFDKNFNNRVFSFRKNETFDNLIMKKIPIVKDISDDGEVLN
ncbi:recombinase family protein [Carboxylicivirga sp. RSCT41]|uniref:recombinase family protein n=1 Tax=Carboxylicivirga agarovorans TaxID=3417570 RepID=UPI003D34E3E2